MMEKNKMLPDCINLDCGGRCCAYRQFPCVSNGLLLNKSYLSLRGVGINE